MKQIIALFKGLFDIIEMIWSFTSHTFQIFADMFIFAFNLLVYVANVLNNLPIWLKTFAVLSISISVIFLILGRNGSENK